jgi:PIN domain nuclease of toxin-antitoxin system
VSLLLLDTHAFLWAATAPGKLSIGARTALEDPGTERVVSAAAAWELAVKHNSGRLDDAEAVLAVFEDVCARMRADVISMSWRHALRAARLSWGHRDPFDRMHAAQALSEGLTLVTADRVFRDVPGLRTMW